MYQYMMENEVLSDSRSSTSLSSLSRRNSSISSHMATTNIRSHRSSNNIGRQSSIIDTNENKQIKQQIPIKVLVFSGKCSDIFKSTIEECVEDCVLQFPGRPSIYVPKAGQSIQKTIGSRQNSNTGLKESNRSYHRRSSITQFSGIRSSQINNLSSSTAVLSSRMRQQSIQQKFPLPDNITEETTDYQTPLQDPAVTEFDSESPQQQQQNISQEEAISYPSNFDTLSQSFSPFRRKLPSAPVHSSYYNHQKDFRLSDLVMRGPEYYAHIFNLSHTSRYATQATSRQRSSTNKKNRLKIDDKYNELEHIKQDLFHRYLWTQKPQVSCRIRPISSYTRSTTFVL